MNPRTDSVVKFPTRLCAVTLALTFATFSWVVWNAYSSYKEADFFRRHDARLQELRGVIIHLDEVLTMSARMAAATSDSRWEQRYRQFEPELDRTIKDVMSLAPGEPAITASTETDEANGRLVAMERQAFALVTQGRGQDARDVLFSEAYEGQKALYTEGMNKLLGEIQHRLDQRLTRARQRAILSMTGSLILLGLSMSAWTAVLRTFKRTQSELEHRVEDRTSELRQANESLLLEVSERRAIQSELVDARNAALEASRLKAEFLANMSHEIRTPMNGVIGMAGLLLDADLTPTQREFAEAISASGDTLLGIINDILDFSKIEAGRFDLDPVPFKLRDTLDDTVRTLAVRAHQKGLELTCDVQREVPDGLRADVGRLRQILVNLVGNAVKFTEAGEVAVSVVLEHQESTEAVLHLAVRDTGIGIPADKQAIIFNAFSQADGSISRKYGGTGLGLAISSKLVQLMGGRMWIDSVPGHGSTFHFTVKVSIEATHAVEEAVARELAGTTVLVVDDNATNRRILGEILEKWRMQPTVVTSGAAALNAVRAATSQGQPFRIVLLDVNMPGMDGFTVVKRLRESQGSTAPAIMMLTSSDAASEMARCRELGVAAYLIKPVRRSTLREAILAAIGRSSDAMRTSRPAQRSQGPSLRVLLAEDNIVNQRVATGLLEKAGHTVAVAANGKVALAAIESAAFDLVLMDVQMPEMSGAEATAAIRERERVHGGHIPIIALTAHALKGDRERCLDGGADGYVSKPIVPVDLFAEIDSVMGRAGDWPVPTAEMAFSQHELLARVGGSETLMGEVIGLFIEDAPRLVADIRQSLVHGDGAAVYKTAHTLKGSAGNFGARSVIDAARRLEARAREGDMTTSAAVFATLESEVDRLVQDLAQSQELRRCA